jgi:iron complex outermembrane recepter protein
VALRQVSVGYNLSPQICKPMHFNSLRLSITARNLCYIWKDAKDGVNPEGLANNNASSFFEYGGLPFQRNIGATLNASF